jgi:hypothetical protein
VGVHGLPHGCQPCPAPCRAGTRSARRRRGRTTAS